MRIKPTRMEPARVPRQRGLTLPEILVALGLTSLVAVALFAMAQLQGLLHNEQNQTQGAQDNAHAAMVELVNNLRLTSTPYFRGYATNAVPPFTPQPFSAVTVVNSSAGPDTLQLLVSDESNIQSLLQVASQYDSTLTVSLPQVTGASGFASGDFFVLANFNQATLYRLLVAPTNVNIGTPAQAFSVTPVPVSVVIQPFQPGNLAVRVRPMTYQIDAAMSPGTPMLVLVDGAPFIPMNPVTNPEQLVAENIEDLQVAIGVDGLTGVRDGTLTEVGTVAGDDEWVYNVAGEVMPSPLPLTARIAAVRVTIVARTSQPQANLGPGRPAAEDHPAGPQDNYRWRALTTTVAMRTIATN